MELRGREGVRFALVLLIALLGGSAVAQERGFRLHRYEGSSAGSSLFLLERPTYAALSYGAVGLTLDYSYRPLVPRLVTGRGGIDPIVSNATVGHLDLAGSLFDRFALSASLPVTLQEIGTPEVVSQVGPVRTIAVGDPRFGLMVRLLGQADRDPLSIHIGAELWAPIGGHPTHQGDSGLRVMPRAVAAGAFLGAGRYTLDAAFLFRPYASYGPPALGMTAASELRVGLAVGASLAGDRLRLGPEAQFAMQVVGESALRNNGMNLELLASAQYLIADHLLLGIGGGTAFFGAAGTPGARAIVRLAWAPRRSQEPGPTIIPEAPKPEELDPDSDGIPTAADHCPFEPETRNAVRDTDGCPEFEMEKGTALARILAPTPDAGVRAPVPVAAPDAGVEQAVAFATSDADEDGVLDEADRCPVAREDVDGFEDEDGCPELDNDQDGLADAIDRCPAEAEAVNGVDDEDGCPDLAPDADEDGVADGVDRCPFEPETVNGVRDQDGCPEHRALENAALSKILAPAPEAATQNARAATDADHDGIFDEADRCPVTPEDADGFEDEDGCPENDDDDDGIADAADRCPDAAETLNGWKDEDGCPDEHEDVDRDGVEYVADRCPLEPGTAPDGCPHAPLPKLSLPGFQGAPAATPEGVESTADLDRDGIADLADPCPVSAEDRDQFEDEDGCPEPDNDRDGIGDAADKCPFAAESINGNKDTDGCPDEGEAAVVIKANALVIKQIIQFKTGAATLRPVSLPLLQQVALVLRAASTLSIEIQGHTDDVGSAAQNIRLSKRRAEAIRAVLVRAGVAPARLISTGFGPTRPRASNKTPQGREQNRRVEFLILGEAK